MTRTEKYVADLLALIERYKAITGKADSGVSSGAFPTDNGFIARLRDGGKITLRKAEKLEDYIEQRLDEIRRTVGVGECIPPVTTEVLSPREEKGEHSASIGSEAGGALANPDGTADPARRTVKGNSEQDYPFFWM